MRYPDVQGLKLNLTAGVGSETWYWIGDRLQGFYRLCYRRGCSTPAQVLRGSWTQRRFTCGSGIAAGGADVAGLPERDSTARRTSSRPSSSSFGQSTSPETQQPARYFTAD